jgi:hypothetical protein
MVADHLQGLVDQVFGQVIALFRHVRLIDELVVLHQVRIPLIRFATEEAVESVEPLLQRPFRAVRARGDVLLGHIMILA